MQTRFLCKETNQFLYGLFCHVPLNMTYLHCLQHSLFEHLFNLYYSAIEYWKQEDNFNLIKLQYLGDYFFHLCTLYHSPLNICLFFISFLENRIISPYLTVCALRPTLHSSHYVRYAQLSIAHIMCVTPNSP